MWEDISKNKNIFLSGYINASTIDGVVNKIFDITYDDKCKAETFRNFKMEPICLYINSGGGSVYDGLSLVDLIINNSTPIHTYCFGRAMSMGLWIFMASKNRYMGKNATLLYHEVSNFIGDKLEGIKQEVSEMERLQVLYDNIITENSNIMQEKLNSYKERKADWFIPAQDALKLGLCHKII